ncbi:MAG: phosphomannose isomerase type II C-terminal cupin domain [Planctomycetota bacterium]|jgi:mannose-6-phosphate isomerase-like protein (cupin superfamily)
MTIEREARPWGSFTVLHADEEMKIKRIEVRGGMRLSLQLHRKRSEHWFVLTGEATVTLGEREFPLKRGESTDIPAGEAHRISNPGSEALIFIEIQNGEYFGEDDIERLEDDYGREV